jgi:hypothetical protein
MDAFGMIRPGWMGLAAVGSNIVFIQIEANG